jgi:muramoyltetrapeptide carboxypeptidase
LHALLQQQGFASIHGGMVKRLAMGDDPQENFPSGKPLNLLHTLLMGTKPDIVTTPHPLNRMGYGSGMMRGGNLSIVYSLRGTPLDYIPEGSILFLEDIGEKPYAVDRMMYNLKLGGVLKRISGLIVGQFSDYEEDPLMFRTVYEGIADAVSTYDYPVCFDFPVGHTERNLPLLMGGNVSLNVQENSVFLTYN